MSFAYTAVDWETPAPDDAVAVLLNLGLVPADAREREAWSAEATELLPSSSVALFA